VFLAESIVHAVDPFALDFGGGFGIRWYGLSYAAGFLVAWVVLRWFARTGRTPLTPVQVGDLLTFIIVGVVVGGRLGDVLFYHRHLLVKFGGEFPFWGVLEIHRGGMSSHGGIIGVLVACVLYARKAGVPALHVTDLAAFAAPPGLAFGRLANWINGELPGKVLPASMQADPPWWSVKYPNEILDPSFARLGELATRGELAPIVAQAAARGEDLGGAIVRACYGGNRDAIAAVAPYLTAHYPNNFIQAATDGIGLGAAMLLAWLRPHRPGVVSGWFLVAYGLLRLGSESFRMPDPEVFTIGPLTLPMQLSALMVLVGATIVARSARRPGPSYGGLIRNGA